MRLVCLLTVLSSRLVTFTAETTDYQCLWYTVAYHDKMCKSWLVSMLTAVDTPATQYRDVFDMMSILSHFEEITSQTLVPL